MSHVVFLTPTTPLPSDVNDLAQTCKQNLLSFLSVSICDEDLCPDETNKIFSGAHKNWQGVPEPKIFTVDSSGTETRKFETTDYILSLTDGTVTFSSAVTDTVRATYDFFPFNDTQLDEITRNALQEISVLIYRPIDPSNIALDYRAAICKRLYTNLLKNLLLEAKDFFAVSVGGRNINKTSIVGQINTLIDQNETQLKEEIQSLIHHNRTNRITPIIPVNKKIDSGSFVGIETVQNIDSDAEVA